MAEIVTLPDGYVTVRKYDVIAVPGWLENNWPEEERGSLPIIRLFVDEETSIVVTNPKAFEASYLGRI